MTVATSILTALLGVLGAVFSWFQVVNSVFRPQVVALIESEVPADSRSRAAVVRITNRGGAPGMIRGVDVETARIVRLDGRELRPLRTVDLVGWSGASPIPFYLAARGTAVIVLAGAAENGNGQLSVTDRVRIGYGVEKERVFYFDTLPSRISEVTSLPPDSLPLHGEPSAKARAGGG